MNPGRTRNFGRQCTGGLHRRSDNPLLLLAQPTPTPLHRRNVELAPRLSNGPPLSSRLIGRIGDNMKDIWVIGVDLGKNCTWSNSTQPAA
jgi:hypothetical protein